MHYSLHDGIQIPCNFSVEGNWMGSLKSFNSGSPTEVAIKAVEDLWIQELSAEQTQQLFSSSPRWLLFKNYLVQDVFFNITQHNADFADATRDEPCGSRQAVTASGRISAGPRASALRAAGTAAGGSWLATTGRCATARRWGEAPVDR